MEQEGEKDKIIDLLYNLCPQGCRLKKYWREVLAKNLTEKGIIEKEK